MDLMKMTPDEAKNAIALLNQAFSANIALQQQGSTQEVGEQVIDLSIARTRENALEVSYPFISLRVEQATDGDAFCNCILNTRNDFQKSILLKLNDTLEVDRGIRKVYLHWDAQAGKSMVIKFFTTARVRSGSLVLNQKAQTIKTIGDVSAPLDGQFLELVFGIGNIPASSTFFSLNNTFGNHGIFCTSTKKYYEETTIRETDTPAYISCFRVPSGFQAEIVSAEFDVITQIGSVVLLAGIAEMNSSISGNFTTAQIRSQAIIRALLQTTNFNSYTAGKNYKCQVVVPNAAEAPVSSNLGQADYTVTERIIDENKIFFPIMYNATATTTGLIQMRVGVKLTKKVK